MIDLVSATRHTEASFWLESALGLSLKRLHQEGRLRAFIAFENRAGLPDVYNRRLLAPDCAPAVVFVHDDVWLDDYHLVDRIEDALRRYDLVGIAGNRRRLPGQPSWAFADARMQWDDRAQLSGAVGHGPTPFGRVTVYGPSPADCELLDGVLLAARTEAFRSNDLRFDPRFSFHFYDLDLCRAARERSLRVGTWPISLTHQSGGAFGTPSWQAGWHAYQEKWRD